MSNRTYGRNAFETTLDGSITAGATSIALTSALGLTAPGYLVIEPENASKREYIKYTGISTNTLTGCSRGLDGSASGAQAHDDGKTVRMVFVHQYLSDIFDDIEDLEQADSDHIGGTDTSDHPEASVSTRGFMSAADKTKLDAVPSPITESDISDLDHDDTDAIHDNVSGEIAGVTLKNSPHENDLILIEDSEASNVKKRATVSSIVSAVTSTDHGALAGLGDDDHPLYLPVDGSRGASAILPDTPGTRNLGSETEYWNALYVEWLYDGSGNVVLSTDVRNLRGGGWTIDEGGLSVAGLLYPYFDLTHDLGQVNNTWRRGYINDLYDSGGSHKLDVNSSLLVGAWRASGHFDPHADGTYDLGDASTSWRRLYAHFIYDEGGVERIDLSGRDLNGNWSIGNLTASGRVTADDFTTASSGTIGDLAIDIDGNGGIWTEVTNSILLSGLGSPGITLRVSGNGGFFGPHSGNPELGEVNNRWNRLYAVNASDIESDLRDKDFSPLSYGLAEILQVEPIIYSWKKSLKRGTDPHLGFGAQDLKPVIPEVVTEDTDGDPDYPDQPGSGRLSVATLELIPVVWNAIREIDQRLVAAGI